MTHYVVASDDMSQRVAAEAAWRESEARYRLLAENATDVIVRLAHDRSILYASPSARQVFGFDPDSVLGRLAVEFVHPDDLDIASQAVARAVAQPGVQIVVYRSLRADGTYVWVESAFRVTRDATGAAGELQASIRDISTRKHAEDAMRETEERYRLLADNATDVIVRAAPEQGILYVSPSVRQVLGYDPQAVLRRSAMEFVHPDDRDGLAQAVEAALAQQDVQTAVYRNLRADGSYIWVETTGRLIRDAVTGDVVELQGSVRDISARKQAEDALLRSEARYRRIVETAQEGIWELDGAGRITFANARLAELLGYSLPEMLGRTPGDFVLGRRPAAGVRAAGATVARPARDEPRSATGARTTGWSGHWCSHCLYWTSTAR